MSALQLLQYWICACRSAAACEQRDGGGLVQRCQEQCLPRSHAQAVTGAHCCCSTHPHALSLWHLGYDLQASEAFCFLKKHAILNNRWTATALMLSTVRRCCFGLVCWLLIFCTFSKCCDRCQHANQLHPVNRLTSLLCAECFARHTFSSACLGFMVMVHAGLSTGLSFRRHRRGGA